MNPIWHFIPIPGESPVLLYPELPIPAPCQRVPCETQQLPVRCDRGDWEHLAKRTGCVWVGHRGVLLASWPGGPALAWQERAGSFLCMCLWTRSSVPSPSLSPANRCSCLKRRSSLNCFLFVEYKNHDSSRLNHASLFT